MIKRVRLENWRSHKNTELEFEKGTNVLIGSMGSGKSSVMNAICFGFFGTYPELQRREAKLEDVIMSKPHKAESAGIKLEFNYNDRDYRIERTIYRGTKTNTAKLYEEKRFIAGPQVSDVTERVEVILETNYELFSRAVYSEQNQMDYFIRLNASNRKQKFDELLELETYEKVRRNAVSLSNSMKRVFEEKKRDLTEQEGLPGERELLELCEKTDRLHEEISEKRKAVENTKKEIDKVEELAVKSREDKKKFRELNDRIIGLKSAIEALEKDIEKTEREAGSKLENLDLEKLSELGRKLDEKITELKEKEKSEALLKNQEAALKARIDAVLSESKNARERLPEKIVSVEDLSSEEKNAAGKISDLKEELESNRRGTERILREERETGEKKRVLESREAEQSEILEKIKGAGSNCPLCKHPLTPEARINLSAEAQTELVMFAGEKKKLETELEEIGKIKKEITTEKVELEKKLEEANGLKSVLASLKEPLERISVNEKKEIELRRELLELEKKITDLSGSGIAAKKEEAEKKKKGIEWLVQGMEKKKEFEEKKESIGKAIEKIENLDFDEARSLELERELEKKKGELNSLNAELGGKKRLLDEKAARESELRKRIEFVKKTRARVDSLDFGLGKLGIFTTALKAAQAELREQLVETINQAMDTVWKRLYPYGDFTSAKMHIESGNYELLIRTRSGNWQKIEGALSGGERSAVALTLRISFSLVLARNLGILILDEPTHNLDSSAISKLGEMMRNHLPGLVEQIFLITHNKEMESAANASLYLLAREKEKEGITKVELLSLRE